MKNLVNLLCQLRDHVTEKICLASSTAREQQSRALVLQTTGMTFYDQGQYADAAPYLESALTLWTVLGNFQAERQIFQRLGSCYWHLGQIQAAYCCYQEALTLARALGDVHWCSLPKPKRGVNKSRYEFAALDKPNGRQ